MLAPNCKEWDEYFHLCSVSEDMWDTGRKVDVSNVLEACASKARQCRLGVFNVPEEDIDRVDKYLKSNQLSCLIDLSMGTGIDHDKLKDILFHNRDRFFMFRAEAKGDSRVLYSALEESLSQKNGDSKRVCARKKLQKRAMAVRWMSYRGFIDPRFFHQPMNLTENGLIELLRDLGYPNRDVEFGEGSRIVFFEGRI